MKGFMECSEVFMKCYDIFTFPFEDLWEKNYKFSKILSALKRMSRCKIAPWK
jgi:hypothetical protein